MRTTRGTGARTLRDSALRPVSVRAQVLERIRRAIILLELAPGTGLSENDLATEIGVSRTPVLESLILLREQGLVEVVPQVGTFVAPVDLERVKVAQFIREAVECTALAQVALPLSAASVADLRAVLADQQDTVAAEDHDAFFDLDEAFHRGLLLLSGHEGAWSTVHGAKSHLDRARRLSLIDTRPVAELIRQHSAVLDHLVAGEVEPAVAALRAHLRTVFEDVERIRIARPDYFTGQGN